MSAILRRWADWFDHPRNPAVVVWPAGPNGPRYTAGYLLRLIADGMKS